MVEKIKNHLAKFNEFDLEFEKEITKSEILRIKVIIIFVSLLLTFFSVLNIFFADEFAQMMKNRVLAHTFLYFFGAVLLVYTVVFIIINHLHRKGKILPMPGRIINAALEGFLPTVTLWIVSPQGDFVAGLSSPPIMAYSIFLILSVFRLNFIISCITGTVAAVSYFLFAFYWLEKANYQNQDSLLFTPFNHFVKAMFLFMGGLVAGFVASQLRKRVRATILHVRQKQEVENLFGQHVSPEVVDAILNKKDTAEEKDISVFFLDIRGFTSFSEKKTPSEVYQELNKIFDFMIEVIQQKSGVINKFLGDGFMAIFGAPLPLENHARAAIESAQIILRQLTEKRAVGLVPDLGIGIGIHSGNTLLGNLGSEFRKEYTIIGDVVNLASRIETLNKEFKSQILVSRVCYEKSGLNLAAAEVMGEIQVKGREEKVPVLKLA